MKTAIVIIDTSGIITVFENGINIDSELRRILGKYHVYAPSQVITELRNMVGRNRWAKLALDYIHKNMLPEDLIPKYMVTKSGSDKINGFKDTADNAIIHLYEIIHNYSMHPRVYVLTNDGALRDRIIGMGGRCIIIRCRNHLEIM